ncbi:MAG: hypothetical protein ACYSO4_01305 [Planctomycetota bacterium]|jgi:hypothetical protein
MIHFGPTDHNGPFNMSRQNRMIAWRNKLRCYALAVMFVLKKTGMAFLKALRDV